MNVLQKFIPPLFGFITIYSLTTETTRAAPFHFTESSDKSVTLTEGNRPVFVYNHGVISKEGVPADRARSSYIHPLYGLNGEVLTDDFPKDHYHHRGLFWAWPHVKVGDDEVDLWMLKGIRHQFERWLGREAGETNATLGVQNSWMIGDKKVVDEQAWFRVTSATPDAQALDVELTWIPIEKPLTLRGAEGKSYGGLTLRYAPRTNTVITTPLGSGKDDLSMTRLPWADLTAQFAGPAQPSGAAIFIAPTHPDYPPQWLTRHYGVLCVGWPGVDAQTFQPGEPIRCRYRVLIHRGAATVDDLKVAYAEYQQSTTGALLLSAQTVSAELKTDRVAVNVAGKPFTEYLFRNDEKYPYFYPVLGPRTGKTVTERRMTNFPHHSSIFFGCDKVNGGNYWQEGLDRGRIVSKGVRIVTASGAEIALEQRNRWERPGAEAPFDDVRLIRISAPTCDLRYIDVDIKLTARTKVRIEKTNHSLFSVRMAPDLSVAGGGKLINSNGDENEKGTFGKQAAWADFRGARNGEIEGVALFSHPNNRWSPAPWFTRDYGFMSPTPMYWPENSSYVELLPAETIHLRYRVVIHAGNPSARQIESEFRSWSSSSS